MLSADRQLANEIEFDLRKFEEEQKELEKQQRERARTTSPANVCLFSNPIVLTWSPCNRWIVFCCCPLMCKESKPKRGGFYQVILFSCTGKEFPKQRRHSGDNYGRCSIRETAYYVWEHRFKSHIANFMGGFSGGGGVRGVNLQKFFLPPFEKVLTPLECRFTPPWRTLFCHFMPLPKD